MNTYSIECVTSYGGSVGTWDGERWNFGQEERGWLDIDEAKREFDRAIISDSEGLSLARLVEYYTNDDTAEVVRTVIMEEGL